jgi:hypothetical protein
VGAFVIFGLNRLSFSTERLAESKYSDSDPGALLILFITQKGGEMFYSHCGLKEGVYSGKNEKGENES